MVVHAFDHNALKAEAGESLQVRSLRGELQDRQGYTETLSQNNKTEQTKKDDGLRSDTPGFYYLHSPSDLSSFVIYKIQISKTNYPQQLKT